MDLELKKMAEGVYLAGPFSEWKVGAWVLQSGDECALMEMPPPTEDQENPALILKRLIEKRGWRCRYLFFTHPHWDHTASIGEYRNAFPEASFIAHFSAPLFFKMSEYYWTKGYLIPRWSPWSNVKVLCGPEWYISNFNNIFYADMLQLSIAGEPCFLIYGPKHSLGDVHCIFKGILFPGDWWLYEGDPCQDLAAGSKAEESIKRLEDFMKEYDYRIHSVFSAHGDNLLYNIDVHDALHRTLVYHEEMEKKMPEIMEWKDFRIETLFRYFFPAE
jgi:glyoxylase-like metal-dependent hydrolase (beta-lactamase superfamily II)